MTLTQALLVSASYIILIYALYRACSKPSYVVRTGILGHPFPELSEMSRNQVFITYWDGKSVKTATVQVTEDMFKHSEKYFGKFIRFTDFGTQAYMIPNTLSNHPQRLTGDVVNALYDNLYGTHETSKVKEALDKLIAEYPKFDYV